MSQIKILSQLMQNQRLAAPVTADSQIAAARDASGELQVFTIGSSGNVSQIFQDEASDTGWSVRDLQYPSVAAMLACVTTSDNKTTVVAVDNEKGYNGQYGVRWLDLPSAPSEPLPSWTYTPAISLISSIRVGIAPDGTAAICTYCPGGGNGGGQTVVMLQSSNGSYTWSPLSFPFLDGGGLTYWDYIQLVDPSSPPGPYAGIVFTTSLNRILASGWGTKYFAENPDEPILHSAISISSIETASGWAAFVLDIDNGVSWVQVSEASTDELTSTLIYRPQQGSTFYSTVIAGQFQYGDENGNQSVLYEAFLLDKDNHLWVAQQLPGSQSGWGDFVPLNDELSFVQICAASTGQGDTELFGVVSDGTLFHIWQNPETTDWNFDEVEVGAAAAKAQLEDVPTYQTLVYASDSNGLPLMFSAATVSCPNDDDVQLEINGEAIRIGPNSPWSGTTNATGALVINHITAGLGSPVLQVSINGVPDGTIPYIDPSGPVQTTLANVTGEQLIQAGILATQYQPAADDIASALQQTMKMVPAPAAASAQINPGSTMATLAGNGGRIQTTSEAWSFDVTSGLPRFQVLTSAEADALVAEAKSLPSLDASSLSLTDAWGDFVSAVERGAASLQKWVINGAQVTLTLLVQGVHYVVNATITLVEEAFDLAEQILTTVGVFFEQLFKWLGYIFDWQNILRTQQALVYTFNQVFQFFQDAVQVVQQKFDAKFQSFVTDQLPALFTQVENQLGATTTLGDSLSENQKPLHGIDSPMAQVVTTHLMQNAANSSAGAAGPPSLTPPIQNIIDQVNSFNAIYGPNEKLKEAISFVGDALNSQDQFLQLLLKGLVAAVEAALQAIANGIQAIVDAVLSAVADLIVALQSLLSQEWNIPVVSQIYQRMTISSSQPNGTPLTALSLMGLLVAVPTTVVYTANIGSAPFPDDASLSSFEGSFTASTLLSNSGLGSSSQTAVASKSAAPAGVGGSNAFFVNFFAYSHAAVLGITALIEPPLDCQLPTGVDPSKLSRFSPPQGSEKMYNVLALSVLLTEISGVFLSTPWVYGPQSWSISSWQAWEGIAWIFSAVKTCADMAFFFFADLLPRQYGFAGILFEFVCGFIEVALGVVMIVMMAVGHKGTSALISGAAEVVGGVGDVLRIGRSQEFLVQTYGISMLVLACSDVVGNFTQAGLTIATFYTDSASGASTA